MQVLYFSTILWVKITACLLLTQVDLEKQPLENVAVFDYLYMFSGSLIVNWFYERVVLPLYCCWVVCIVGIFSMTGWILNHTDAYENPHTH